MIEIRVKDSENFEAALRRFKKEVQQSGVLSEMRRREHYEKPSVKRKMKILAARKKARKRSM
ncbi:MAG: 30S ribosomal protein S21 [candidate division FCPU426 bacterium]|jgi:small subunit ribosomal protein S21